MTKIRDVDGLVITTRGEMTQGVITVRVTSDELGQSLSLASEDEGLMLFIPVEPVSDMIQVEE